MHWLRDYLRELADRGKTIFLSSHLLGELELMADRVVVINHGRLLRDGTLAEWHDEAEEVVQVSSPDEPALKAVVSELGGRIVSEDNGLLRVKGLHAGALGDAASRKAVALHHLSEPQQSLEQLYLQLCLAEDEKAVRGER
jgi:ABC-2 type transport system ATP-binding protein